MSTVSKSVPSWVYLSVVTNIVLGITLGLWFLGDSYFTESLLKTATPQTAPVKASEPNTRSSNFPIGQLLTYQEWVNLLKREAKAVIKKKPDRLMILAGDSLSLWFPMELLPSDRTWLNQSISGESTKGLLRRLDLFKEAQPEAIFVMIGINDLLKGASDDDILKTQAQIVTQLQTAHPRAKIVMQSILPRVKEHITAENADKIAALSNERIYQLNRRLAAMAEQNGVYFLDLQPLVADPEGYLRNELTTDGLHLSRQGYLIWRSAIETFNQLSPELKSPNR